MNTHFENGIISFTDMALVGEGRCCYGAGVIYPETGEFDIASFRTPDGEVVAGEKIPDNCITFRTKLTKDGLINFSGLPFMTEQTWDGLPRMYYHYGWICPDTGKIYYQGSRDYDDYLKYDDLT